MSGECPRCGQGQALSEGACERCGGHLLEQAAAARLLSEELGQDIEQLRELAGMFGGAQLTCPACGVKQPGLNRAPPRRGRRRGSR